MTDIEKTEVTKLVKKTEKKRHSSEYCGRRRWPRRQERQKWGSHQKYCICINFRQKEKRLMWGKMANVTWNQIFSTASIWMPKIEISLLAKEFAWTFLKKWNRNIKIQGFRVADFKYCVPFLICPGGSQNNIFTRAGRGRRVVNSLSLKNRTIYRCTCFSNR